MAFRLDVNKLRESIFNFCMRWSQNTLKKILLSNSRLDVDWLVWRITSFEADHSGGPETPLN